MVAKYITIFLASMLPLWELRGSIIMAVGMELDFWPALVLCCIGNMIPVPFIYFFAHKVLLWGADKKYIGKFFRYCLAKGENGGDKLKNRRGWGGLFIGLTLFVGIPLPGTGAWTGALVASFLGMNFKNTVLSVSLGVILAGIIMSVASHTAVHVFGF